MESALRDAAQAGGVPVTVNRVGSMLGLFVRSGFVRNYGDARSMDAAAYGRLFWALLQRWVYFPPAPFETVFLSPAHIPPELDKAAPALHDCFRELTHG